MGPRSGWAGASSFLDRLSPSRRYSRPLRPLRCPSGPLRHEDPGSLLCGEHARAPGIGQPCMISSTLRRHLTLEPQEPAHRIRMVDMSAQPPIPTCLLEVDEDERVASITRLKDLFGDGAISYERFSAVLEQVFAASNRAELRGALVALPPLVRLTPPLLRLRIPLIVRAAEGGLRFGPGWQ